MAPQIGAAKAQISEVADFFGLVFLRVAWVGGCGRDHEVVDDVAVVRIIDGDGSVAFLGKIQNIFVAGVVDKPEVRDGVGFQAAAAVPDAAVLDATRICSAL